ncbi:carnitine O-palmitoyltransferase 1, liver isoform-like isoform X2 [Ostrea edulis]|uniref:carnitine O-palmitoyltransferase 1, liver isoform-like isoform X2 n=1 Tax=Ostrea edulis TaxID=37623 RepID=UPI0024AF824A|nr:carnitine O-palmitoyltransferase 1, liver isoform-like isoform X2 [Ostrea edulis]
MPSLPAIAPFLGDTSRLISYRKFSEASAVGFLSAILFVVFSEPLKTYVDFGEKWMSLSGLPYQMNTAMLGFIVGFGFVKIFFLMRIQLFRMLLNYQGWMTNPKSMATKMWALMLNALRGNGHYPTYFFQPMLPKLPVPNLNVTLDRYLASMKPILSDEDYMNLTTAVLAFKEKDGPILHKYLCERAATKNNWLIDYWQDFAYLVSREPCAVKVNCYATDRKDLPTNNQIARAANLIHFVLRFHEQLQDETLTPQYLQDMIPMCMEGYRQQFSTTRIPYDTIDRLMIYEESKHIIIYRNGVYYQLDVFAPDSDGKKKLLTVTELHDILSEIVCQTEEVEEPSRIAVFTSERRDTWAKVRQRLLTTSNRQSLEAVESAIFFLSLDDVAPKNIEENGSFTMTGNGFNRWFDKSIQFSAFGNGKVGTNVEHASVDATLPGRMWEYFLKSEKYVEDGGIIREKSKRTLPKPQRLEWDLHDFEKDIDQAYNNFQRLAGDFELIVTSPDYGKGFIKKKRMSPDGFIQMALQLAYYKLYNKTPKTYESASTRMFCAGRTETIRPVSDFSVQWVKSMFHERATRDQRIMLLRRAVQYQTQVKIDASLGMGWDRHLFGMYVASRELKMPLPVLFQDKSFWMQDALSTSQTPTRYADGWTLENCCMGGGFMAVDSEGYGVSYMIYGEDHIKFHVTSHKTCDKTSSTKLADAIVESMNDMKDLLS